MKAVLVFLSACGAAATTPSTMSTATTATTAPRASADPIDDLLPRLHRAADCERASDGEEGGAPGARRSRATRRPEPSQASGATIDAATVWCLGTRGWAAGTAPAIPDGVLVGVTIGLERDRPDAELPRGLVTFSAFAAKDGKVFVTDIPPVNASEQKMLDAAAAAVTDALTGRAPRAELPRSLLELLKTLPIKYPVQRAGNEWRYSGQAEGRIRRVGDVWVVIEIPKSGPPGVILSIYTDRAAAKNLPR